MAKFRRITSLLRNSSGTSSVEYGVILGMIVLVIFLAMQGVAEETIGMWENVSSRSSAAIGGK